MITWKPIKEYTDILFEQFEGIAKITINRPRVYNAFRPQTNAEMLDAVGICRERNDIGVVVLTGAGDKAFCSGGDQNVKGTGGYIDENGVPRLNVLDLHKAIRSLPKPVIAMVNGYSIHSLRKRTIRADRPQSGQFRCRFRLFLSRPLRRTEESTRNLVPLQAIHRSGSPRNGDGERGGAIRQT